MTDAELETLVRLKYPVDLHIDDMPSEFLWNKFRSVIVQQFGKHTTDDFSRQEFDIEVFREMLPFIIEYHREHGF